MTFQTRRIGWGLVATFMFLVLVGCGESGEQVKTTTWERVTADDLSGEEKKRYNRAEEARKNLARTLMGRLSEVLPKDGPAEAIEVCNLEAQGLTDSVGNGYGVRIGRTSFRLRNPNNTPPDWARQFNLVEKRVDRQVVLEDNRGSVAVFTPIHLAEKCTACHGPRDQLDENVKQALGEKYPDDEATGFHPGELRGWFWVESSSDGS